MKRVAALLLVLASGVVRAQGACDYNRCALSISPRLTGLDVVRGTSEIPVASLGFFVPRDVRAPFASSDIATRFAVDATRMRRQATVLSAVGALATATGIVHGVRHHRAPAYGFTGAGASLLLFSVPMHFAADAALSRAVWEYNRQFAAVRTSGSANP